MTATQTQHEYNICTDDRSATGITAPNVADALRQFGAPDGVRGRASFCDWLFTSGGYGSIEEDGATICRVSPSGSMTIAKAQE